MNKFLPALLVGLRVVLAPVIFYLLVQREFGWVAGLYFVALLSDVFDGVIARKLGVSTLALRIGDGVADIWLFLCLGVGILQAFKGMLAPLAWPFFMAMGLQVVSWGWCFAKFRKLTSYHSWMSKVSGLFFFLGIESLLIWQIQWPLMLALWYFTLNMAEEITMTSLLPKYHHDVWSLPQAWRLRREDLMGKMSVK